MCSTSTLEMPRASRGPFSATLVGFSEGKGLDPSAYSIHVCGLDGEHMVHRRYSHFVTLRALLLASYPHFVTPPPLPPKSFFKKRVSAKFLLERATSLRHFFLEVLKIDRFVTATPLSEFLAIGKPSTRQPAQKLIPVMSYGGREGVSYGGLDGVSYGGIEGSPKSLSPGDDSNTPGVVYADEQAGSFEKVGPGVWWTKTLPSSLGHTWCARCRLCLDQFEGRACT